MQLLVFNFFCILTGTMKNKNTINIHPDQKYINALLTNDAPVLKELYQNLSGKIKWMILQNNGTATDAADIFQEALLAIYDKAKNQNFKLTCPLEAIIYLICKNKWINELNKRKVHKATFNDIEAYNNIGEDSFKISEECLIYQARKNLLQEKLSELGENCRNLLQLNWDGKTMEEVATILKVSYGYARKKKSICMLKLITLIKESAQFKFLKW